MDDGVFTRDCSFDPYWWDETPRPELDARQALPESADVVVIGSGYTGLNAALVTARGGRDTWVLDAESAGWGCSTRNGGQISTSVKPSFEQLARRHGATRALEILREGHRALEWIADSVNSEDIECGFEVVGRFHAAHTPAQYEQLVKRISRQPKGLEVDAHAVPRAEQHAELGSDAYFGGVVFPKHAALDPARYHQGLLERTLSAGASVVPHCAVTSVEQAGKAFLVTTTRGRLRARDVVVATNGYTGTITPWLRRRVIPIGSYVIATEAMGAAQMARLMPKGRIVSDTRTVVYYYRPSPDQKRILFGGRVSTGETDPRNSGRRLHADLVKIFPEVADVRVTHSWLGFVAYTFDTLAHVGRHQGLHFALGYCGSGVSMASYLGMRVGSQVLGLAEGRTGFDGISFPTRPLYTGKPWFVAPALMYYRWRDRQKW